MARLVKESGILGKAGKDLTAKNLDQKVSYDQIILAINKVQQRMGITGTTSKEAASTIEGSTKSMKAAWNNLLTSIADDNQDMSKSVNIFVDSAVTAAKNLVPRIKTSIDGIKKLINSIVTEVFPKLKREIPELRPLIETFEWFIDHKTLVANSVKLMIAAFAIKKINSFTKGMTDLVKGVLTAAAGTKIATTMENENTVATTANTTAKAANTTATALGTTATKGLTAAQNLLNAAWKSNPIGLIITGVTTLVTLYNVFKKKTEEVSEAEKKAKEELEKQTDAIKNNKDAWDDLQKTKQSTIDAGMTEISHYENLYNELTSIVDANGRVKKGYEDRASFITSTLSEALGIEIKTVDGVIQKYANLKDSIDKVIEKKKAQIILDSQETLYAEAIQKQSDALATLRDIEGQLNDKKSEKKRLNDELLIAEENYQKALEIGNVSFITKAAGEVGAIEKKIEKVDEETSNLQSNYNEQEDLLKNYAYNIGQYEKNMELAHKGEYDKMTTVNWNYVKDYQKAGDAEKAQLKDQIKNTETNLALLKQLKDKSGTDIYDSQIKAAEKQLAQQKADLKKYQSATQEGLNEVKNEWDKGVNNQINVALGKKLEFKKVGKNQVQMYVDGVKEGEPKSTKEMETLVNKAVDEVSKGKKSAKTAGEDLIEGVNNGVKNEKKQSGVFSSIATFGSKLLGKLKASLKEKSPSKATKEMGQFLLEGLGIGIEQEEGTVLNQISNVGKNVLNALQDELNSNVRIGNIQANIDSASSSNNANNYYNTVEAFKEALSEMKIEMDDQEMGKFVDKTVSRTIYS